MISPRLPSRPTIALLAIVVALITLSMPLDRPVITRVSASPTDPKPIDPKPTKPAAQESPIEALDRRINSLTTTLLARLDESDLAEAKRAEQRLTTALSELSVRESSRQARGAELSLSEFLDRTYPAELREIDEEIRFYQTEFDRSTERLEWSKGMLKNKLLSEAQLGSDKAALTRIEMTLKKAQGRREMLESATRPRKIAELEGEVERTNENLQLQTLLLDRERAREAAVDLEAHARALNRAEARCLEIVLEAGALRDQARRATDSATRSRSLDEAAAKLLEADSQWSEALEIRLESRNAEVTSRLRRASLDSGRRQSPPPPPRPGPKPAAE